MVAGSGRVAFEDLFQPAKLDGTEFGMPGIVRGQYGGGKCVDEALIAEQKVRSARARRAGAASLPLCDAAHAWTRPRRACWQT